MRALSLLLALSLAVSALGQTANICFDTCAFANNGDCDDGYTGSVTAACDYGTDCADCGPRSTYSFPFHVDV